MVDQNSTLKLDTVLAAQQGCQQSLDELSAQVEQRVYAFIFRMQLDHHLAEDLTQDTLIEMVKSLDRLEIEHINGFWAWVYRTAQGKIQHHHRVQGGKRIETKTHYSSEAMDRMVSDCDTGPETSLFRREMILSVLNAMGSLKDDYRQVLMLRCMEAMPYAQIAPIMGGSELKARLLFLRAKLSLKKALEKGGVNRSFLLSALTLFTWITAKPGKVVATAISSNMLQVGPVAASIGFVSTKVGLATIAAVLALGAGTPVALHTMASTNNTPTLTVLDKLKQSEFQLPSQVLAVGAWGGNQPTFVTVDRNIPHRTSSTIPPHDVLVEPVSDNLWMGMAGGHWIQLEFPNFIEDRAGPDLFYCGRKCSAFGVILLGEQGERFRLPIRSSCVPVCGDHCLQEHVVSYDLADHEIPFPARRIRIVGLYGIPSDCFQLHLVGARIQDPNQP
ncbi:RNA polymerase sigma factor [Planctomycetota bacterium]